MRHRPPHSRFASSFDRAAARMIEGQRIAARQPGNQRAGMFISFEGIDGAGKSGHIPWLKEKLEAAGVKVIVTREPGGTPVSEALREMLLRDAMDFRTELMIFNAARQEHLVTVIEPALARGETVLCDRFEDSTYAYQCGGRQLDRSYIDRLSKLCIGRRPDITLLFDLPIEVAQERMRGTRVADRFEVEASDFHSRVRNEYLRLAHANPDRIKVIDANRTIEAIREDIATRFALEPALTESMESSL